MTAGQAGPGPKVRAKRGEIQGWSPSAVRRHTRWLYSVDADALGGAEQVALPSRISPDGAPSSDAPGEKDPLVGVAVTLTLQRSPESAADWERLRRAWITAVQRLGAVLVHWVVEWQARGVPHLHCAIYFRGGDAERWAIEVIAAWLQRTWGLYGAKPTGQHWNVIDGPLGWLQYLSKHAARGVKHYQRQGKPPGWEKTGRLWGHTGDWPVVEPSKTELSWPDFWRLRRLVRSWRVADARAQLLAAKSPEEARQARRRIRFARRMLQSSDPGLCRARGISEWVPLEVFDRLLLSLEDAPGYASRDISPGWGFTANRRG